MADGTTGPRAAMAGTAKAETWLTAPAEPEQHLQTVLFAKVMLALMHGRPAERCLDAQRAAHLRLPRRPAGRPPAAAPMTRASSDPENRGPR